MELELFLAKLLTDLGFLLFLAFLLTTGRLWTKGQVNDLKLNHKEVLDDKNVQIEVRDREIIYWRDMAVRLLEVGERIAGGEPNGEG